MTLVELVVSVVVIAIAVAGVLLVISHTTRRSADPMVRHQAVAVAQSYLEEILLEAFEDPDGGGNVCPAVGAEAGESRGEFDDVDDYDGLSDAGARDQGDNPVAGLGGYTVDVTVTCAALGTGPDAVPASDAKRVEVRVRNPPEIDLRLSGYRARF